MKNYFRRDFRRLSDTHQYADPKTLFAAFQFTGDDVYKLIRDLSGGEKRPRFPGKADAVGSKLFDPGWAYQPSGYHFQRNFGTGTQRIHGHRPVRTPTTRYFINQTATRILELVNQTFVNYIGNYDYYLEKKEELTAAYAAPITAENPVVLSTSQEAPSDSKLSWQEQKEQQAKERKRKNELKKTEDRIAVLEERNEEIDMLMTQEEVYSNSVKCQELALEKDANNNELEELYERWEELAE